MRRWHATTALAALMAMAVTAQGQPVLPAPQAYAQSTATDFLPGACDSGLKVGTAGISASCAAGSAGSSGGALAIVNHGSLRINANADTASVGTSSQSISAWSSASFVDSIAISGPAGKTALLTGTIYFNGSLGATASGSELSATNAGARYNFSASFFGQDVARSGNVLEATNGTSISSDPAGAAFLVSVPISFDNEGWAVGSISMTAVTQADASARPYQPYSGAPIAAAAARSAADFGHTLYWGGISSLTVDGVELTGYSLLSASGTDYRFTTAVPEPGTVALLLVGLAIVGRSARRFSA